MVVTAKNAGSRYARGIRAPDPAKLRAVRELLERDPAITKKALAEAAGLSRTALGYYLRAMRDELAAVATKNEDVRRRQVLSHLDLVERVSGTADEVRSEISKLRATNGANPAAIFAGYRTLVAVERLLGELLGEVRPASTTVYMQKIDVLLATPADDARFSPELRAALAGTATR